VISSSVQHIQVPTVYWRLSLQGLALLVTFKHHHVLEERGSFVWEKSVSSGITSFSVLQEEMKTVFWSEKALMIYNLKRPTKVICGWGQNEVEETGKCVCIGVNSYFPGQMEFLQSQWALKTKDFLIASHILQTFIYLNHSVSIKYTEHPKFG
jgi:hypothetical protein